MKFDLHQAIEVLERTPGVLRAMLAGLSQPWVQNNYGPETFSPFDVVGHLIHGERHDWMPRMVIILEHGPHKPFEPFDRYAMYEDSKGKTIDGLLDTFARLRSQNIAELTRLQLTPQQLTMTGTHPDLGEVTLEQLMATWVVHDLNHTHQIAKAQAWQYRDHVGPWRSEVSIIK